MSASQIIQAVEGVWKVLGSLLGPKGKPDDGGDDKTPDAKTPTEIGDIAKDDQELSDSMDKMRADLAAFGTSVGGIVVAVITALGYTRFNDIFPFPLGAPGWLGPATAVAAGVGLGATTFLIFRFFFAKRRILLDPPIPRAHPWWQRASHWLESWVVPVEPLDQDVPYAPFWRREHRLAIKRTQPYALAENLKSLKAVEDREIELLKELHRDHPDGATNELKWKEAYRLERVVDLALWDASASVLERRTRGAFGGPIATIAIVLAVGGVGFTFATADWAKGRRTLPEQRVREAQVCLKQARTSSTPDQSALVQACLSKAKLDLGSTVSTVTVTVTTTK